jgi:8-oxo-dGTP pyrophosphatase MutT (NUDIX family)
MDPVALETRTVTAGAYISLSALGGLVPFMVGPTKAGDRLGVVRLGGHREPGESSWECAHREVLEEARLRITHEVPPATYRATLDEVARDLEHEDWAPLVGEETICPPLLISTRGDDPHGPLSVMYLARSDDVPEPAAEAKGLLLLDRADVDYLISAHSLTLREYLQRGGQALFAEDLPLDTPLQPFAQLRWLGQMLRQHPNLLPV